MTSVGIIPLIKGPERRCVGEHGITPRHALRTADRAARLVLVICHSTHMNFEFSLSLTCLFKAVCDIGTVNFCSFVASVSVEPPAVAQFKYFNRVHWVQQRNHHVLLAG